MSQDGYTGVSLSLKKHEFPMYLTRGHLRIPYEKNPFRMDDLPLKHERGIYGRLVAKRHEQQRLRG